jgi:hypothetical protein
MSDLLSLHLDKVKDPEVVPAGEYELRISSAKIDQSKSSDRKVLKVVYDIVDESNAQSVFDNMAFPIPSDDEKTQNFMLQNIKKFCLAFGLDLKNPGDPSEWKGLTAFNNLQQGKNEQTGDLENTTGRWQERK